MVARGSSPDASGCTKNSIWLNVCRNKVADGLLERIMDPNKINQNHTNICGIAAFVRDWAQDDPAGYAWLGISLYEAGWGRIGRGSKLGQKVQPSPSLKNSPIPFFDHGNGRGTEMNHADWVVLASVREALNDVFGYSAADLLEPLEGLTTPGEVVKAFKAAGYTSVIEKTSWASGEGFDNIKEASNLHATGWRVALLINERMLHDDLIDTQASVATANHWVGLQTTIDLQLAGRDYIVSPFLVFTWGQVKRVPERLANIPFPAFLKNYYGFVAAKY